MATMKYDGGSPRGATPAKKAPPVKKEMAPKPGSKMKVAPKSTTKTGPVKGKMSAAKATKRYITKHRIETTKTGRKGDWGGP